MFIRIINILTQDDLLTIGPIFILIIWYTSTEVNRNNVSLIKIIRHWIHGIDWNNFLLEGSSMSFTSASQRPAIKKSMLISFIIYPQMWETKFSWQNMWIKIKKKKIEISKKQRRSRLIAGIEQRRCELITEI